MSAHEEIATSDEGYIQDKGKDTNEEKEEELGVTGDNTNHDDDGKNIEENDIVENNSEEFDGSDDGMISTNDSIVTGRNVSIKTGSDCKRKAESGDDKTEDGKKQRNHDQT